MDTEQTKVLVMTKDSKISSLISAMLIQPLFIVDNVTDPNEVRRKLYELNYDIIIVDSGDGSDTDFAVDISDVSATILLLAPTHLFDQISYRVEPYGILTLTKPFDNFYFYNMIKVAIAVGFKIQKLSSQTMKLKEKMEEIRVINRAKMLLMQDKGFTETEAHHHLEKTAMDNGLKRIAVAQSIIQEYS